MAHTLIKVAADIDNLYADYSSITNSFHGWGPREEISQWSNVEWGPGVFAGADRHGSTSFLCGFWDDEGIIYKQRGILRRSDIFAFLCSFDEETQEFDYSILEPLDG